MFKFLRKYNKWILAFGGTLLLITFLIPFAFQDLQRLRSDQGSVRGHRAGPDGPVEVTGKALQASAQELEIVSNWLDYIHQSVRAQRTPPQAVIDTWPNLKRLFLAAEHGKMRDEHWYLLTTEAEEAGLVGGPSEAATLLMPDDPQDTVLAMLARGLSSDGGNRTREFIQQALAKARGAARLIDLYREAPRFSDRRIQDDARRLVDGVDADLVVLESSPAAATVTPTEEELAAQLQKYADIEPGKGDHGFGYRLPNRVRLEWISVEAPYVRAAIEKSGKLSQVELRKHWKKHESDPRFGKPDPAQPVPAAVREDLLAALTSQRLEEIAKFARGELAQARRALVKKDGYLVLPEGWFEVPLGDLGNAISQQFNVEDVPYNHRSSQWLREQDLASLPGLGLAETTEFGQSIRLPALAMHAHEFGGSAGFGVQARLAGPFVRTADGSFYIWRILRADPAHAATGVDEVRQQLVNDVQRLAHYQSLAASSEELKNQAVQQGMVAMALARGTKVVAAPRMRMTDPMELQIQMRMGQNPKPVPTTLPVVGRCEPAVRALIALSERFPTSAPLADIPADQRTIVIPVPEKLCVVIAQITDREPLTRQGFAMLMERPEFRSVITNAEQSMDDDVAAAFSYEALAKRHQYERVKREEEEPASG